MRKRRVGECMRCGQHRRSVLLWEMICQRCYVEEPKATCGVCGKQKRFVTDAAGVCPKCIRKAALPTEIECARCGRKRRPAKAHGRQCGPCQIRESRGRGVCSGCARNRLYFHKKDKLCSSCTVDRYAETKLRRDLESVSISNDYNLTLFHHLVERINWPAVTDQVRRRLSAFAKFLQSHRFDSPLTWDSIQKISAELPGPKYYYVRLCLQQLGELLLDPRTNEEMEESNRRNRAVIPLSFLPLPTNLMAVFKKYDLWLRTERKNTPAARLNHFHTLGDFWKWCDMRGLTLLATVEAGHVEEYLHTRGLKWTCQRCSFTKNVTARGEAPPSACENLECRALHSYEKAIRCVGRSVDAHRARLRIFFGWLKDVEEGIEINPAPAAQVRKRRRKRGRRTRKYPHTIRYYDWEVVDALLKGIEDPSVPPEEGMVLYLLLHHAFYLRELKSVRIPPQCRPIALGAEPRESLEDVLSLEWQPRELSRRAQSLGRSGEVLQMEPRDEPWLRDLVRRFERERNQKLRNANNPYLFVGIGRSLRGGHLDTGSFRLLVERATARITGRVCTVGMLGKCSRLLHSEFGGYEGFRHLRELGLGEYQARRYQWMTRVRMVPKQANRTEKKSAKKQGSSLTVPPIDVFGIPTTSDESELRED